MRYTFGSILSLKSYVSTAFDESYHKPRYTMPYNRTFYLAILEEVVTILYQNCKIEDFVGLYGIVYLY